MSISLHKKFTNEKAGSKQRKVMNSNMISFWNNKTSLSQISRCFCLWSRHQPVFKSVNVLEMVYSMAESEDIFAIHYWNHNCAKATARISKAIKQLLDKFLATGSVLNKKREVISIVRNEAVVNILQISTLYLCYRNSKMVKKKRVSFDARKLLHFVKKRKVINLEHFSFSCPEAKIFEHEGDIVETVQLRLSITPEKNCFYSCMYVFQEWVPSIQKKLCD